jgi:hypothetical protein
MENIFIGYPASDHLPLLFLCVVELLCAVMHDYKYDAFLLQDKTGVNSKTLCLKKENNRQRKKGCPEEQPNNEKKF